MILPKVSTKAAAQCWHRWMDLSAVFDTVDHNIFLAKLKTTFSIKDRAIE